MRAETGVGCLIWIAFGAISAAIAAGKGRSAFLWFFLGMLIPLPAIIIICCLSNLKEEAARFEQMNSSNRRLREQLKQEKMKNEKFRRHAARRLDFHDQQLGVDSRGLGGPGESGPPRLESDSAGDPGETGSADPETGSADRMWDYERGGKAHGPIRESELGKALRLKHLDRATLVWTDGMSDWMPAGEVPELSRYFEGQERG